MADQFLFYSAYLYIAYNKNMMFNIMKLFVVTESIVMCLLVVKYFYAVVFHLVTAVNICDWVNFPCDVIVISHWGIYWWRN